MRNVSLLLAVGLVATGLSLLIIYLLSGVLSAPLERLAAKVAKIQNMDGETLPVVRSKVREIDVLARAIDTLDSAVKSFASFVPVGLVKELLATDEKTQLGGHSRFLTILFSDVEGSTALFEELGDLRAKAILDEHNAIVRHHVAIQRGVEIKSTGDGFMVVFSSARRALLCAIGIQRSLAANAERERRFLGLFSFLHK